MCDPQRHGRGNILVGNWTRCRDRQPNEKEGRSEETRQVDRAILLFGECLALQAHISVVVRAVDRRRVIGSGVLDRMESRRRLAAVKTQVQMCPTQWHGDNRQSQQRKKCARKWTLLPHGAEYCLSGVNGSTCGWPQTVKRSTFQCDLHPDRVLEPLLGGKHLGAQKRSYERPGTARHTKHQFRIQLVLARRAMRGN